MRIEHFVLDENGYLKINKYGWGVLHFPGSLSKLSIGPSHSLYGTPVPPSTVETINKYLKWVYKQKNSGEKGKGLVFRRKISDPNTPYKKNPFRKSINSIKPALDFLTIEERQDFELKAGRRSMNNLIMGLNVILPDIEISRKVQDYSANYQMRHTPIGLSTGELYYLDTISEEHYYKVLISTIGFPWNFSDLKNWEIKNGYKKIYEGSDNTFTTANAIKSENDHFSKNSKQIKDKLEEIEAKLEELKSRPQKMSMLEWTTLRSKLLKEKDIIDSIS